MIGNDPNTIVTGDEIQFATINDYDNKLTSGTVEGIVSYPIANSVADLLKYNTEVKRSSAEGASAIGEVANHMYILLRTTDSELQAFALDWIDVTTLIQTNNRGSVTILLKNVNKIDVASALTALRQINISAAVYKA